MEQYSGVYFLGIGGIGMSALARYFALKGRVVAGYDRTPSAITSQLAEMGIGIHFTDDVELIPSEFRNPATTMVVYTPAVPETLAELAYFRKGGFQLLKRAQVLGMLALGYQTLAIAGTHGKTTTSTLLAHLLGSSSVGCDAFLGGISKNFGSNMVIADKGRKLLVAEADEYDRSFLNLHPQLAVITSVDADHLDIYGDYESVVEAFNQFAGQVKPHGTLIVKSGLGLWPNLKMGVKRLTYGLSSDADFHPVNLSLNEGCYSYSLVSPNGTIDDLKLGVPGLYNLENSIAAAAAAITCGISHDELRCGLLSFSGVSRRFDIRFKNSRTVYVDDYAHHPREIEAMIESARQVYPNRKITGVFQPHLYSRTRDFAFDFAKSLDKLDMAILLEIYPAREQPIEGITSRTIADKMSKPNRLLLDKADLLGWLRKNDVDVLLTMGAGDIDRLAPEIVKILEAKQI
jgi:UDP-N-acetylmuramate--alanine ligase